MEPEILREQKFQSDVYTRMFENCMNRLSCCNPKTMDLYEETESALKLIDQTLDKFYSKARECEPLDTRPREAHAIPQDQKAHDYKYFVSVGFPQKDKVFTRHFSHAKNKVILAPQEYRGLTTNEQYCYIVRGITQVKDLITSPNGKYHYFIEQCKSGDLHFHARIDSYMAMKDIKLIYHNAFGISLDHIKYFCVIKMYDALKWSDYENKTSKSYQKTDYKHIIKN